MPTVWLGSGFYQGVENMPTLWGEEEFSKPFSMAFYNQWKMYVHCYLTMNLGRQQGPNSD